MRSLLVLTTVTLLCLAPGSAASAQAALEGSPPAQSSTVQASPAPAQLAQNQPVPRAGSSVPAFTDLSAVLAPLSDGRSLDWASGPVVPLETNSSIEFPTTSVLPLEPLAPQIPTPAMWLGYPLGERFTQHPAALDYLEELARQSPRMSLWQYGVTYEGRMLRLAAISSPENLDNLEELRRRHLRLANGELDDDQRHELARDLPAFVWLAYGVHGNESSSMEAALATAYLLTAGGAPGLDQALENVVVLLDPLVNPDGRERYVAGFLQRRGRQADAHRDAYEHEEPWPGGRYNHYLFDLNRDWPWLTQEESRRRVEEYRRWEPHVYVDFHEMEADSTYYFPPAAEPVLDTIDDRVLNWLEVFGQSNASAFDGQGWFYYEGERFDLFYPGYGDTYPALRHGVGMTYEMAGHGFAGQAVQRLDGTLLTLSDRIARHLTTSLATVATAALHHQQMVKDFGTARAEAAAGPGETFLWAAEAPEAQAMARLLADHGIRVQRLAAEAKGLSSRRVRSGEGALRTFDTGTLAVSTAQPLGALARTLLEREAELPEGFVRRQRELLEQRREQEFSDITAWSLPLAFGVEVFRTEAGASLPALEEMPSTAPSETAAAATDPFSVGVTGRGRLAYLLPPQGLAGWRLAAWLQAEGIRYSLATAAFESAGRAFPAGTLMIPATSNGANLDNRLDTAGRRFEVEIQRAATGLTASGISLGSSEMIAVKSPRVALVAGDPVSPTAHGALWHLLDETLHLPHSRIDRHLLHDEVALAAFDVVILPDGRWKGILVPEDTAAGLGRWLDSGGTLVAIGAAAEWLHELELSPFGPAAADTGGTSLAGGTITPSAGSEGGDASSTYSQYANFDDLDLHTPGAIFATELSPDHPLTHGLPAPPPALVLGTRVLQPVGDPRNDVVRIAEVSHLIAGFAWPEAQERLGGSLVMGLERRGDGQVVAFAHDPAFRAFWRSSLPLLLNSVLHGPSLAAADRL